MSIHFPLGKDSFAKLRQEDCYYVDKTGFVRELVNHKFEVNLITRPRRFGKTLMMSMLEDFFDISRDSKADFDGLEVYDNRELCSEWMNQWPTIFLTLKNVDGNTFDSAYAQLEAVISDFCIAHCFLGESDKVNAFDRDLFYRFMAKNASNEEIKNSLFTLTRMLNAYYGKTVIILIDEYDVPLAKASEKAYYGEMLDIIRSMFDKALKSNDYLKFAVVTGCLRISKESIFTGTNNFVSDTVTSDRFDEYIGFTENDVKKILSDAGFLNHAEEIKFWYDGYHFGAVDVYCPWDVLNHLAALQTNTKARPKSYWENTSHNNIIRRFIDRKDLWEKEHINEDFETLLAGGSIVKTITENLTYDMLHSSADNLWSLLYLTGYLTQIPQAQADNHITLTIPNEEIRRLFKTTVADWFKDEVNVSDRSELFNALWGQNEQVCSKLLTGMLFDTISYNDYKEDYYHAFVTGILSFAGYKVKSNAEAGEGRPDIILMDERNGRAILLEIKRARTLWEMDAKCDEALEQIEDRQYARALENEFGEILCCGICFFKKKCQVKMTPHFIDKSPYYC